MCAPYIKHMSVTARRPAGGKTVSHRLVWVVVRWCGCAVVSRTKTKYRAARGNGKTHSVFARTLRARSNTLVHVALDTFKS